MLWFVALGSREPLRTSLEAAAFPLRDHQIGLTYVTGDNMGHTYLAWVDDEKSDIHYGMQYH